VTARADGPIDLWSWDGRLLFSLPGHAGGTKDLRFDRSGGRLASCGPDGMVRLWALETRTLAQELAAPEKLLDSVALSPDGQWVAGASSRGVGTWLWRLPSGTAAPPLRIDPTPGIRQIKFSNDGTLLAAGGKDGNVRIWNLASRRLVAVLHHDSQIDDLEWSPDGRWIGVGSPVQIWETGSWTLQRQEWWLQRAYSVRFSPDGKTIDWATWEPSAVRLATLPPAPDVPADPGGFRAWLDRQTSAVIAPGEPLHSP
jgi:WD40 repeat protein